MTEASRFPHLALPFAIVGAAGGWLSASFVSNPLVHEFWFDLRLPATVTAAIFAALAGVLLTRWCRTAYYKYDLLSEPGARSPADTWWRQTVVVLGAGAASGALVNRSIVSGALAGLACAAAFMPVCLVVIAAARRAKRARLGSLVSASDRRAVWAILATALSVATLEALLGWPAAAAGEAPAPVPAILMLGVSALVITGILVADARGLRRAKNAFALGLVARGLVARDPTSRESTDIGAPRLDLGLGEDLAVHVAPAAAAYRGRDRTLSLVQGDPGQTVSAFRRAFLRGGLGLAVVALVACTHFAASSDAALAIFDEQRCERFVINSCRRLADAARETSPLRALRLYEKTCTMAGTETCVAWGEMPEWACGPDAVTSPESCVAAGEMYLAQDANDNHQSHDRAMDYFRRACRHGDRKGCLYIGH